VDLDAVPYQNPGRMDAAVALLLAAVELQAWGEAPFEQAAREQKPVLLLVAEAGTGDPSGADLSRFVPVAVDPVERPDVADLFRTAASLLPDAPSLATGPVAYLLTPDRRVFAAAPAAGGFVGSFLERGGAEFQEHRGEVDLRAGTALALLRESQQGEAARGALGEDTPTRALRGLVDAMDPIHGGFRATPKAPPHGALRLLLEEVRRARGAEALRLLKATLDGMARGKIHDPAGGFFSAAEGDDWGEPLLRKRLPDNALLLRAYAQAYDLTGETRYRAIADEIATFCVGELREADGTFDAGLVARADGGWRRDERVVAGWNGLLISGLAASGRKSDLGVARRAATAVLERLGPAALLRRFGRGGDLGGSAFLEDYAYLLEGLLDLGDTTGEPRWTEEATALAAAAVSRFLDSGHGGFFDTDDRHGSLPARIRNGYDGELPSANGVMASALLKLERATGERRHAAMARKTVEAFLGDLQKAPRGLETLAAAAGELVGKGDAKDASDPALLSRAVRGPVTVEVTLSAARVRPGAMIEARVALSMAEGYSVNPRAPGKDLVGLSVSAPGEDFVASPPRYPEPSQARRGAGAVPAYVGSATVTVPLRARPGRIPGDARVRIRVGFQACDATDCRAPDSVLLDIPVSIVPTGR
jgi:uncharacterized protein YyaL (SSP411 family)